MDLLAGHEGAGEAQLRCLGWLAAGEHVVSLASAGEGNMNRTLRARLGARSIVLKQAVPYVARYPSIPAPVERLDAEAAFYRLTAATTALSEHTPSLLGEDAANHLLCLEDLG